MEFREVVDLTWEYGMYLTLTGICNNIFGYFVRLFARQLLMLAITPLSIVFSVVKES